MTPQKYTTRAQLNDALSLIKTTSGGKKGEEPQTRKLLPVGLINNAFQYHFISRSLNDSDDIHLNTIIWL